MNNSYSNYLQFVIPDVNVSIVQAYEHPRFARMKIGTFYTIRPRRQLTFYVQPQRLTTTQHNVLYAINLTQCN